MTSGSNEQPGARFAALFDEKLGGPSDAQVDAAWNECDPVFVSLPSYSRWASPLWKVISSTARKQARIHDLEALNEQDSSQFRFKKDCWRRVFFFLFIH